MLKLVTQFDDMDKRVSVSTPSCCGCCSCCCCCCVATVITSSAFTAMNLRATGETNNVPASKTSTVSILGALYIPIAGLLLWLVSTGVLQYFNDAYGPFNAWTVFALGMLLWLAILGWLYAMVSHKSPFVIALKTAIITALFFAIEFAAGAALILATGGVGAIPYLILAIVVPVALIRRFRKSINEQKAVIPSSSSNTDVITSSVPPTEDGLDKVARIFDKKQETPQENPPATTNENQDNTNQS